MDYCYTHIIYDDFLMVLMVTDAFPWRFPEIPGLEAALAAAAVPQVALRHLRRVDATALRCGGRDTCTYIIHTHTDIYIYMCVCVRALVYIYKHVYLYMSV